MIYKSEERRGKSKSGGSQGESSGNRLQQFPRELAEEYGDLKQVVSACVQRKPMESVLLAFGCGLLLGRFKVRPLESVLLAAGAGLLLGFGLVGPREGTPKRAWRGS
jgi:ElaB/YqjD/DUF883 family membrane-anchored ribosome-binding protein